VQRIPSSRSLARPRTRPGHLAAPGASGGGECLGARVVADDRDGGVHQGDGLAAYSTAVTMLLGMPSPALFTAITWNTSWTPRS